MALARALPQLTAEWDQRCPRHRLEWAAAWKGRETAAKAPQAPLRQPQLRRGELPRVQALHLPEPGQQRVWEQAHPLAPEPGQPGAAHQRVLERLHRQPRGLLQQALRMALQGPERCLLQAQELALARQQEQVQPLAQALEREREREPLPAQVQAQAQVLLPALGLVQALRREPKAGQELELGSASP